MSLADHFQLDPTSPSGVAWARKGKGFVPGDPCGYKNAAGYWVTGFRGVTYLMHRVVFELTHGYCPEQVDHENLNKGDNTPANLRPADRTTNKWNTGIAAHNTSGVKGLSWNERRQVWVGRIRVRKRVVQKYSRDKTVLVEWLTTTRAELHKEYARHE